MRKEKVSWTSHLIRGFGWLYPGVNDFGTHVFNLGAKILVDYEMLNIMLFQFIRIIFVLNTSSRICGPNSQMVHFDGGIQFCPSVNMIFCIIFDSVSSFQ